VSDAQRTRFPRPESRDCRLELGRTPFAATRARRALREQFADRMPAGVLGDLLLVVSELVNNAVEHGTGRITVRVALTHGVISGEVADEGTGFIPFLRAPRLADAEGRGLDLVSLLVNEWDATEGTSAVWFTIAPDALAPPGGRRA
jgi:anti-sigma regulatory factor (Ser/Thr protein kinase)